MRVFTQSELMELSRRLAPDSLAPLQALFTAISTESPPRLRIVSGATEVVSAAPGQEVSLSKQMVRLIDLLEDDIEQSGIDSDRLQSISLNLKVARRISGEINAAATRNSQVVSDLQQAQADAEKQSARKLTLVEHQRDALRKALGALQADPITLPAPIGYLDPQSLRNFTSAASTHEWLWVKPDAGLEPVYSHAGMKELGKDIHLYDSRTRILQEYEDEVLHLMREAEAERDQALDRMGVLEKDAVLFQYLVTQIAANAGQSVREVVETLYGAMCEERIKNRG